MDEENQQRMDETSPLDLTVPLPGFVRPEIVPDNRQSAQKIIVDAHKDNDVYFPLEEGPNVQVKDARTIQGDSLSVENACDLFRDKGFCLFPQKTQVKNWNEDYIKGIVFGSDISKAYAPELEAIIRNHLLSDYHVVKVECPAAVLRRGPQSKNNFYGSGVHQDYGLTLEDFKNNKDAYDPSGQASTETQTKFDQEAVCGIMIINFWRPIDGYTKENPLVTKPLAVCDSASVKTADTLHTGLNAEAFGGLKGKLTDQMALKHSPDQRWFYYPNMIDDEVLVFKQLEIWKDDPLDKREEMPGRGCFHTAFEDPNTPEGAPPRKSTECRVVVYVGKKKTDEEKGAEPWIPPAPLWPKTSNEWGNLGLDFASLGMIFAAVFGKCPEIPDYLHFAFSFCIVGILVGMIKFFYSLRREGNDERHPCAKGLVDMLGLTQLGLGIWGMVLVFPNLSYLADPSPETCELGPMLAMFIPAVIIALVIIGVTCMVIYACLLSKKKKETVIVHET